MRVLLNNEKRKGKKVVKGWGGRGGGLKLFAEEAEEEVERVGR